MQSQWHDVHSSSTPLPASHCHLCSKNDVKKCHIRTFACQSQRDGGSRWFSSACSFIVFTPRHADMYFKFSNIIANITPLPPSPTPPSPPSPTPPSPTLPPPSPPTSHQHHYQHHHHCARVTVVTFAISGLNKAARELTPCV